MADSAKRLYELVKRDRTKVTFSVGNCVSVDRFVFDKDDHANSKSLLVTIRKGGG